MRSPSSIEIPRRSRSIALSGATELASIYQSASELLQRSQDPSVGKRLIVCARTVIEALGDSESENRETPNASFMGRLLIQGKDPRLRASADRTRPERRQWFSNQSRSAAGLQTSSEPDLFNKQPAQGAAQDPYGSAQTTPYFQRPGRSRPRSSAPEPAPPVIHLHAEDDKPIAHVINEMFSGEAWRVELCVDVQTVR